MQGATRRRRGDGVLEKGQPRQFEQFRTFPKKKTGITNADAGTMFSSEEEKGPRRCGGKKETESEPKTKLVKQRDLFELPGPRRGSSSSSSSCRQSSSSSATTAAARAPPEDPLRLVAGLDQRAGQVGERRRRRSGARCCCCCCRRRRRCSPPRRRRFRCRCCCCCCPYTSSSRRRGELLLDPLPRVDRTAQLPLHDFLRGGGRRRRRAFPHSRPRRRLQHDGPPRRFQRLRLPAALAQSRPELFDLPPLRGLGCLVPVPPPEEGAAAAAAVALGGGLPIFSSEALEEKSLPVDLEELEGGGGRRRRGAAAARLFLCTAAARVLDGGERQRVAQAGEAGADERERGRRDDPREVALVAAAAAAGQSSCDCGSGELLEPGRWHRLSVCFFFFLRLPAFCGSEFSSSRENRAGACHVSPRAAARNGEIEGAESPRACGLFSKGRVNRDDVFFFFFFWLWFVFFF